MDQLDLKEGRVIVLRNGKAAEILSTQMWTYVLQNKKRELVKLDEDFQYQDSSGRTKTSAIANRYFEALISPRRTLDIDDRSEWVKGMIKPSHAWGPWEDYRDRIDTSDYTKCQVKSQDYKDMLVDPSVARSLEPEIRILLARRKRQDPSASPQELADYLARCVNVVARAL